MPKYNNPCVLHENVKPKLSINNSSNGTNNKSTRYSQIQW